MAAHSPGLAGGGGGERLWLQITLNQLLKSFQLLRIRYG